MSIQGLAPVLHRREKDWTRIVDPRPMDAITLALIAKRQPNAAVYCSTLDQWMCADCAATRAGGMAQLYLVVTELPAKRLCRYLHVPFTVRELEVSRWIPPSTT